jgi:DNA-binding response OmpR family regulator
MPEEPIPKHTVLAVLGFPEERAALATILAPPDWHLRFTHTFEETRTVLNACSFHVVISEACLSDGHCWKDLLLEVQNLANPPPLIVTDRLADERLWAEVLNLGGCDLITKPFDAKEVLHVVNVACAIREFERQMARPEKRSAFVEPWVPRAGPAKALVSANHNHVVNKRRQR